MARAKKKKDTGFSQAGERMRKKGTTGSFTEWCRRQGFDGVTNECIRKGLASKNPTTRKRAAFAKAARTVARRRKGK